MDILLLSRFLRYGAFGELLYTLQLRIIIFSFFCRAIYCWNIDVFFLCHVS